jgi:Asp-tRNA(Asn)/Glu-tRNA(Gln) amidotransferase A subunit family amidase
MNPGSLKDEFPSAAETTQKIQTNRLDMCENVANLARRCRKYGRDENGCNAITEEMYDEAYQQAQVLARETGKNESKPVLYGVPISVKDQYAIKGYLQTGGLACRLKSPAMKDSLIIQLLKNAGAIPLCRGNTVQTMMLPECVNRIWGRSRNPWYVLIKKGTTNQSRSMTMLQDAHSLLVVVFRLKEFEENVRRFLWWRCSFGGDDVCPTWNRRRCCWFNSNSCCIVWCDWI